MCKPSLVKTVVKALLNTTASIGKPTLGCVRLHLYTTLRQTGQLCTVCKWTKSAEPVEDWHGNTTIPREETIKQESRVYTGLEHWQLCMCMCVWHLYSRGAQTKTMGSLNQVKLRATCVNAIGEPIEGEKIKSQQIRLNEITSVNGVVS